MYLTEVCSEILRDGLIGILAIPKARDAKVAVRTCERPTDIGRTISGLSCRSEASDEGYQSRTTVREQLRNPCYYYLIQKEDKASFLQERTRANEREEL
jgi:hypothetical protein